jgi:hypothetical protein
VTTTTTTIPVTTTTTTIPVTTTTTTIPVTTTTTTIPGCYTYSVENNDQTFSVTIGYNDCDGNAQSFILPADTATPDFCAEQNSVLRQSGTFNYIVYEEATSCTVTTTTTTIPVTTTTTIPVTTTTTTIPVTPTTTTAAPCACITVDVLNTQLTDGGLDLYYILNQCGSGATSM